MAYQVLEKLHRLQDGFIQSYRVGTVDVLLVQWQGRLYGFHNHCPHQGAPLHHGAVFDGVIRCPLHGLEYRLEDGEPITGFSGTLKRIDLIYEGATVGVDLSGMPLG
ncbi:Rieske (2Fe-2S) protein [Halioxenophilus aromaticivorans]|uniref:Rieske domain-containing protein n=1 Tax=Halioxenophilus aromaticivorans TaxID=1306992 RepID=A0AAV3UAD1_9ALTE